MTFDIGCLGYRCTGKAHANAIARLPMFFPDVPETNRDVIIGRNETAGSELGRFVLTTTAYRSVSVLSQSART